MEVKPKIPNGNGHARLQVDGYRMEFPVLEQAEFHHGDLVGVIELVVDTKTASVDKIAKAVSGSSITVYLDDFVPGVTPQRLEISIDGDVKSLLQRQFLNELR